MKEKLLKALKWCAYPAFYFFCLLLFGFLTFPFDRLKDRLLAEIGKQSKGKSAPVITLAKMDSYWLTGVEVEGLKVRLPADDGSGPAKGMGMGGFGMPPPPPAKDSVIDVKEAHARARLLPLIIGRVQLDFWASVFGGEVEGTAPAGTTKGDVALKIADVSLAEIDPLQNLLGIPIDGKVNGELELSPTDGKFNKSNGKLELSIKGLVVSDGKTKIQGLIAIPPAKVEEIAIAGEAEKGVLKITKLSANGPDLELDGEGKINIREPWAESSLDLYVKFRFTEAYRGKSDTTKMLLGEPGSTGTPMIENTVAKLKKAKRADGFYGFHIHGKLKKLEFTPSATETSSSSGAGSHKGKGPDSGTPSVIGGGGKKVGGVALPLGASSAANNRDKDKDEEKKEEPNPREEEKADDRKPMSPPAGMRNILPNVPVPSPQPPEEPPAINAPPSPGPGDTPPGGDAPPGDQPPQEPPPPTEDPPR